MKDTEVKENSVICGDCLEVMKDIPDNSVDSIVTDPPYELGFMGKSWDNTGIANNTEMWKECLRVLKPGGYLLSFGGTRTYHRMAVAIEDAGFEVRDMIEWVYGSGFPKSLNIGKAVDKIQGNEREVSRVRTDGSGNATSENNMYDADHKFVATKVFKETKGTSEWEGWGTALKASFTKGWFIGGDDSGKITDITDKTGSTYWKNQYVLGDYEITPIEDKKKEIETIEIGGIKYPKEVVENALKDIKPL